MSVYSHSDVIVIHSGSSVLFIYEKEEDCVRL